MRAPLGGILKATLTHRAGTILAVAKNQGHRHLVLGAWGCGVFGNHPGHVADAFATWLAILRSPPPSIPCIFLSRWIPPTY